MIADRINLILILILLKIEGCTVGTEVQKDVCKETKNAFDDIYVITRENE